MANDDEVRRKINQILDSLAEEEKKFWKLGIAVGAPVFAGICLLVFLRSRGESHEWTYWILPVALSAFAAFAAGTSVFWVAILPKEKRARESYITCFSSKETRLVADRILGDIPALERNLETFSRFRRKLGVIVRRFRCHACGARVKIEHLGQIVHCPRCKVELVVPVAPSCPCCGKQNTRVISPEEQVAPIGNGKATAGGGLIYGPVGLIAGGILDAIYRPFKLGFRGLRVATKAHVLYCDKCFHKWATTLQSLARDR